LFALKKASRCKMPIFKHTTNSYQRQQGQTMVFALVFIVVILIGVVTLFNTGQLTRHKMEVQNAADAAAYSMAVLTARELNFMAYTNRAMLANQISIGQFAAFESWGAKYALGAAGNTIGIRFFRALPPPLSGFGNVIAAALQGLMRGYDSLIAQQIKRFMAPFATFAKKALPYIDSAYALHQSIMRRATGLAQVEALPKIIDANAKDATLSNFGFVAALLSVTEQQIKFLNDAGGDSGANKRFAAFVNDSRDTWTKDRIRDDLRAPSVPIFFGWPLPWPWYVSATFNFGFDIRGGTELRYLENDGDEIYNWSSLDSVGLSVRIEDEKICFLTPDFSVFPPTFSWECFAFDIGTIPALPLGGAASELSQDKTKQFNRDFTQWWPDNLELYGGVFEHNPGSAIEAITAGYQDRDNGKYDGLPHYTDLEAERYGGVNQGPVFLISVRKNAGDLGTSDQINDSNQPLTAGEFAINTKLVGGDGSNEGQPGNSLRTYVSQMINDYKDEIKAKPKPSVGGNYFYPFDKVIEDAIDDAIDGVFKKLEDELDKPLNGATAFLNAIIDEIQGSGGGRQKNGAVFAIAAGHVYFKNPDSPDEKGSTFSPYWQARLQPVDDNIRKWSVRTQLQSSDSTSQAELTYTEPDPETSGVVDGDSKHMLLDLMAP